VSIGFALVAVVALIIIFVIILGKKIIGKFWQKRETTDSFIS
jgi:hypothetical protein